ncbi:hypothetical protein ZEAMMB73_Zm00001d047710 [Zea mays]|uniref:Uncharacterized protein n=1 Tax=Zea mays TaxID=4577 RepID=A0A1D6PCK0_MAIZE|nr:hypothetical protein ZEAMMB73_Zm00001d047710 [Zea mays]AQL07336.1 hypothetical protein ZEAMMB73_Zm00001d047710 [Zea mays]AQL07354.1 hypothetical protein ZEAMMB73_Zm00001d047710 [Zea mays]
MPPLACASHAHTPSHRRPRSRISPTTTRDRAPAASPSILAYTSASPSIYANGGDRGGRSPACTTSHVPLSPQVLPQRVAQYPSHCPLAPPPPHTHTHPRRPQHRKRRPRVTSPPFNGVLLPITRGQQGDRWGRVQLHCLPPGLTEVIRGRRVLHPLVGLLFPFCSR